MPDLEPRLIAPQSTQQLPRHLVLSALMADLPWEAQTLPKVMLLALKLVSVPVYGLSPVLELMSVRETEVHAHEPSVAR